MIDDEDNRLVNSCLSGNEKAYEALIDKYQNNIFNNVYRMIQRFDDAEEITQIVFIKAFNNLEKFKSKYKFFSWIYKIAVNETLNYLNQQKRFEELPEELVNNTTPHQEYEIYELQNRIQNALMELDPQYRLLILLKHFENFSYREIADIISVPEKTVKSRLFSARQYLKEIFLKMEILNND